MNLLCERACECVFVSQTCTLCQTSLFLFVVLVRFIVVCVWWACVFFLFFFFAVDTLCGLKDSICSLLPLVVETLVHAYTSTCLFSSYTHTFAFVNVCIHAFMCLWLRKQVKSWWGNESHLAGSSTVKKKKWEAYTQTVSIWKNKRFISKDPFFYLF